MFKESDDLERGDLSVCKEEMFRCCKVNNVGGDRWLLTSYCDYGVVINSW